MKKPAILQWLTLIAGSGIVTAWTFFRFATKSINFDLVGQQLLTRQWLEGNVEGSVTAPTNYIVKMVALYLPGDMLGIDPKLFLVISTVLINIATFVGLYFILKAILRFFSVKPSVFFNLSMLWLATISGSVFWIQFTNSRNLELVAGLVLLYLGLLIYRKITVFRSVVFMLLAGLTYFADPLQLMMTSVILVAYLLIDAIILQKKKASILRTAVIIGFVGIGYILSLLAVALVAHLTNVEFFSVSSLSQSLAIFTNLQTVVIETAKNTIRLIAGTNEMGVWRQVLNIMLVAILSIGAVASVYIARRQHKNFIVLLGLFFIVPLGVYAASGQPVFQTDTSRYLILLALALILLFSALDLKRLSRRMHFTLTAITVIFITVGAISLVTSTIPATSKGILSSEKIQARYQYLEQHNFSYGYASMDTAIPAQYLYGKKGMETLLPLSCNGKQLRKVTLFFDKNVFIKTEGGQALVPIILDRNSIKNHPHQCTVKVITKQLGDPLRVDRSNGDTVLIYSADSLSKLGF